MKKLAFLLSVITLSLFSANVLLSQIDLEVKVGLQSTNMDTGLPDMISTQALVKPTIGVAASYQLDKLISIGTGLNFNQKGFSVNQSTGIDVLGQKLPIGVKAVTEISYVEVPLQLKFNFGSNKVLPYVAIGPVISYASKGNIRTKATALFDFNMSNTELNLSSEDYNRTQIHGALQGGVKIPYGNGGHWLVELGYQKSFTDLVSDQFTADLGGKHKGLNINIGYGLRF